MKIGIAMFPNVDALRDRGAHRALLWLPQDNAGGIDDSNTERFLDDLAAGLP